MESSTITMEGIGTILGHGLPGGLSYETPWGRKGVAASRRSDTEISEACSTFMKRTSPPKSIMAQWEMLDDSFRVSSAPRVPGTPSHRG